MKTIVSLKTSSYYFKILFVYIIQLYLSKTDSILKILLVALRQKTEYKKIRVVLKDSDT